MGNISLESEIPVEGEHIIPDRVHVYGGTHIRRGVARDICVHITHIRATPVINEQ